MAGAIFNGKTSYSIEHSHTVRLTDKDPLPGAMAKLQVAHNDMARVILCKRRRDRVRQEELSARAGIPSVNHLVFTKTAMLAWQGMREPSHPAASDFRARCLTMGTRAAMADELRPLPAGAKALAMSSAVRIWNTFPELRTAMTKTAAETVVKKLVKKIPF